MQTFGPFFTTSYTGVSSPIIGAVRHNGISRALKPYITLAVIVLAGFLLFLATHNLGILPDHMKEPFRLFQLPQSTPNVNSTSTVSQDSKSSTVPEVPPKTAAEIQNSTLGFEKVILLNMPSRTDKLDLQILSSSLTGFNFTVIDGVRTEDIDIRALPWDWPDMESTPPNRGCWRAHMNAIRTIVHEGISSALIIEDDSDWDVNLKSQLVNLAAATQKLLHQADKPKQPHSPYGDGWDLLWLGHCATTLQEDSERVLIRNDPTVAPPSKRWDMWDSGYNKVGTTNSTRVVSRRNNAICTNAYAVTLAGAQKILFHGSYTPNEDPIDVRYNNMCESKNRDKYPEFECLHVHPSMINSGAKPGRMDGDSDQPGRDGEPGAEVEMRPFGYTFNTIFSNKLNMRNLIQGLEPTMQWREEEMFRDLDESKGVELEYQPDGWMGEPGWDIDEAELKLEAEMKKQKKDGETGEE